MGQSLVPGGVWRSVHRFSTQPHKICLGVDMDGSVHNRTRYVLGLDMEGSVHNRTSLEKVTQAYFSQKKRARRWSREVVRRSVHRFSVHNRIRLCLGVDMDGSVHNRTSLKKVTQVYFSLEKWANPWGSPEVSTPIQYTAAQDYVWL